MEEIAGQIIKENRKRLGYIQDDIAAVIGTSHGNYVKKEQGKVPFTAGEFLTILSFFRQNGAKCLLPKKFQFFDNILH